MDRDTLYFKDLLAARYAELVYFGLWFTPLKKALDAFFDETQKKVSGKVKLQLYKGNLIILGRSSPNSLYREEFATFGHSLVYDHSDAAGFIRLFGLPLKVRALLEEGGKEIPELDLEEIIRD